MLEMGRTYFNPNLTLTLALTRTVRAGRQRRGVARARRRADGARARARGVGGGRDHRASAAQEALLRLVLTSDTTVEAVRVRSRYPRPLARVPLVVQTGQWSCTRVETVRTEYRPIFFYYVVV